MPAPRNALRIGLLLFAASVALNADWKVYADKKPNQITGTRNARAIVGAKGLGTADLLLGCVDGQPYLRIAERFRAYRVEGGYAHIKLRASGATDYIDANARVDYQNGTAFVFLDDKLGDLLPRMKSDEMLLAQLPYESKDEIVKFPMAGLGNALAKLAEAGCRP